MRVLSILLVGWHVLLLFASVAFGWESPQEGWKPVASDTLISFRVERPVRLPVGEPIAVIMEASEVFDPATWDTPAALQRVLAPPVFHEVARVVTDRNQPVFLPLPKVADEVRVRVEAPHILCHSVYLRNVESGRPPIMIRPEIASRITIELEGWDEASAMGLEPTQLQIHVGVDRRPSKFEPYSWQVKSFFDPNGKVVVGSAPIGETLEVDSHTPDWSASRQIAWAEFVADPLPPNDQLERVWKVRAIPLSGWRIPLVDQFGESVSRVWAKPIGGARNLAGVIDPGFLQVLARPNSIVELQLREFGFLTRTLQLPPTPIRAGVELHDPVVFRRPAPIEGRVTFADGRPVVGFPVEIGRNYPHPGTTTMTDVEGRFAFPRVEVERVILHGSTRLSEDGEFLTETNSKATHYLIDPIHVDAGVSNLTVVAKPAVPLHGTVEYSDGSPVHEVRIVGHAAHLSGLDIVPQGGGTISAVLPVKDGRFIWYGLPEGYWKLFVNAPGSEQVWTHATVAPGTATPHFTLEPGCNMSGVVHDPHGNAASGVGVWVNGGDRSTRTDHEGRYWLWHIPHGEVTLHASDPEGLRDSTDLLDLKTPSITHNVHLTSKPGRFLPILVVDARTEDPVHGASVSIGLEGAKLFGKTTNAQGLVRLGPLLPGKYSITVSQYESSTPGWLIVNEVHSSWITVPEGTEPAEALSEQILRVESR